MILHGYCYFNRKGGFYTAPFFNQYSKDLMLEMLERSYKSAKDEEKSFLLEADFMFVGKFDDHSGVFDLLDKPEFLRNFTEEVTKDEKSK